MWFNRQQKREARQHTQNDGTRDRNGWPLPYTRQREDYENRTGLCFCCNKPLDECVCDVPGC